MISYIYEWSGMLLPKDVLAKGPVTVSNFFLAVVVHACSSLEKSD